MRIPILRLFKHIRAVSVIICVYHTSLNAADTTHNLSGARTGDSLWLLLVATLVLAGVIVGVWRRWIILSPNPQTHHLETQWLNAIEFLDEPIVLVDKQDRIVHANRAYYRVNRISADDVCGQKATAYCHPSEVAPCPVCEIRDRGKDATITLEANDPCNVYGYPAEIRFRVVRDRDGNPIGMLQHSRNLSHTREAENLIRKSETQFRALLETAPDPLIISDATGNIILVNKRCENVLGYTQNELIGQSVEILVPQGVRHRHESLRNNFKQTRAMHIPCFQLLENRN